MELTVRKALPGEEESVIGFYYDLIDNMIDAHYNPKWQKDIYPDREYLSAAVAAGEMYLAENGGEIAGAMILNSKANEGYAEAQWGIEAEENEVMIIHTLGVKPALAGQGVGSFMVGETLRIARERGLKAIRLDVLHGNLPAERLYLKFGFGFISPVLLYYEDTGWCSFDLYEYVL